MISWPAYTVNLPQQELGASSMLYATTLHEPFGYHYITRQESGVLCGLILKILWYKEDDL